MNERQARTAEFAERFPGAIILPYQGHWPDLHVTSFVAPGAVVIGRVTLGEEASIWFNTTVRGDIAPISIGKRSNIQDGTVVHVNEDAPVVIGEEVTIGHSAVIHGTTIGDGTMVGMGAIVLSYSRIGSHVVIAAGALVAERMDVPDGAVIMGIPGKMRQALDDIQQQRIGEISSRYVAVSRVYLEEASE